MKDFCESLCKQYCSEETYRYWGESYWPEKFIVPKDPTWLDWLYELSPTVKIVTATTLTVAAVAGVYWMMYRQKPVVNVPQEPVVAPVQPPIRHSLPAVPTQQVAQVELRETKSEEKKQTAPINKREKVVEVIRKAPQELRKIVEQQRQVQQAANFVGGGVVYQAGERIPVDTIVRKYIEKSKYKRYDLKQRVKNPDQRPWVIKEVLDELGLPQDCVKPTEPDKIEHYNHVMVELGLKEFCIPGAPTTKLQVK